MSHFVMFTRDIFDEVFEDRRTSTRERFDQLVREIHTGERVPMTFCGQITHDGNSETFLAWVEFNGSPQQLAAHLQEIYDDVGVAGWFQVAGAIDVVAGKPKWRVMLEEVAAAVFLGVLLVAVFALMVMLVPQP